MKASLPIKDIEMINKMKDLFLSTGNHRGYLLFVLSINTGINLKDLLALKVKDVKNKKYLIFGDKKVILLNNEVQEIIKNFIKDSKTDEPLFKSRSGNSLDRVFVFNIFKGICMKLGVQDKYSVASWRKTFAYH